LIARAADAVNAAIDHKFSSIRDFEISTVACPPHKRFAHTGRSENLG
jgi:hypothetical protein